MGQLQSTDYVKHFSNRINYKEYAKFYDNNKNMFLPSNKIFNQHTNVIDRRNFNRYLVEINENVIDYSNYKTYNVPKYMFNSLKAEIDSEIEDALEEYEKTNQSNFDTVVDNFIEKFKGIILAAGKIIGQIKKTMVLFTPIDKPFYAFTEYTATPLMRSLGEGFPLFDRTLRYPFILDKLDGLIRASLYPMANYDIVDCCMVRIEFMPGSKCIVSKDKVITFGPLFFKDEKIINSIKVITYRKF